MHIDIYGKRGLPVEGGPFALWVYRKEFGTDLYQDMLASISDGEVQISVWLQIVWAMNRTADDSCPSYGEWLRGFPDFDLADEASRAVMDRAMTAGFFRRARQAWEARKVRRALARPVRALAVLLDRLATRLVVGGRPPHEHE